MSEISTALYTFMSVTLALAIITSVFGLGEERPKRPFWNRMDWADPAGPGLLAALVGLILGSLLNRDPVADLALVLFVGIVSTSISGRAVGHLLERFAKNRWASAVWVPPTITFVMAVAIGIEGI